MTFDAYSTYCTHQRARNQPAPSREWWDMACAKRQPTRTVQDQAQADLEFDHAKELEGDAQ